jgi:glucose/arabinose dehydrogenase
MMKRLFAACIAVGLMTASLAAQQKPAAARPAQAKPEPTPEPEPPPSSGNVRQRNVSIEVTIADQAGAGEAVKKVVTMIVTDRRMGSVRSGGSVAATSNGAAGSAPVTIVERRDVTLNVDANPVVQGDGSVLLSLTLEYIPRPEGPENTGAEARLNQRMTVTLESGKPMVISRAADPAGNRKINVEVTATVMK